MIALANDPKLTWNVVEDVRQLFEFPFMVNALRAGTIVAVTAGLVGWFMVTRKQSFAGHTLAVIGFPGAAGAVLVGVSAQLGFFVFCVAGAIAIAVLPRRRGSSFNDESAVIACVQAFALACGYLFVTLHGASLNGINALLFGNIVGITEGDVLRVLVAAVIAIAGLAVIGRPLLFASVDPDVATARGVPVGLLSVAFMLLLGLTAAASAQITGALLVFTLLVIPAATAQTVTTRTGASLLLSVALATLVTWLSLGIAYYSPYPSGFWTTTIAFSVFITARAGVTLTGRLASAR